MYFQGVLFSQDMKLRKLEVQTNPQLRVRGLRPSQSGYGHYDAVNTGIL